MKYYLIAGEASGDLHASNLMKQIKLKDSTAEFRFWGGDLMKAQGGTIVKHYRDLAFMGFVEVVANLKTILNNLKICKNDIKQWNPDVVILVDYPGFNMRIGEFAKEEGLKVHYYISPQVWAWKQKRAYKIKNFADKVICILPFEKEFYKKFDMDVDYVGHPLLDAIEPSDDKLSQGGSKVIALLPGSRKQEISKVLPSMLQMAKRFPDYKFVIAAAPTYSKEFFNQYISSFENVSVVVNETYKLLKSANLALVTSGTATLETALFKVPQVVCYKGNVFSYYIAKLLVKIKYISLVNLILDKPLVTELIQNEFSNENLYNEILALENGMEGRKKMLEGYDELIQKLGGGGASKRTAELIVNAVSNE